MNRIDAHKLFLDGADALADMEANGICLDVHYLKKQDRILRKKTKRLKSEMDEMPEGKIGMKLYGEKWDPSNHHHLAAVLMKAGHDLPKTEKGNPKTDKSALENLKIEFVDHLRQIRRMEKITGTYLAQWLREVGPDGKMHPVFNLHFVQTYRSSSDSPNFQNIPRRDKYAQRILRRGIIPSPGNILLEVDYGSQEVRIIACASLDPVLMKYIIDDNDMHHDCAGWVFDEPSEMVSKDMRDIIKNMFVFPEFYGSWWQPCAENIWASLTRFDLATADGRKLKSKWRTFDAFAKQVKHAEEKEFWKRFSKTREWQDGSKKEYERKGYFDMLTGFRCSGVLSRNDLFNWKIQGPAFHCLLWALIRIIKKMRKHKMKSKCIGQIHDSGVFDVRPKELFDLVDILKQTMENDIRKEWKWLVVPLKAEIEASPIDGSWYEKRGIEDAFAT